MLVEKAVAASYLLATKDRLHDTAIYIRESILTAFRKSKEISWPPTLEDVKQMASEPLLEELECFLCLFLVVMNQRWSKMKRPSVLPTPFAKIYAVQYR